jgi:Putative zinc-finger
MSHLGQRISALIDGELSDSERDRVLTHIAGCDECRQEAVALRALKQRMHSLGEAMADAALTGRLMAMAMPPDGRPWTARPPWRTRGVFPAARMLTAGILASAVAGLGAAAFFAGGEQPAPGPKVTPAVDTFLVQHAIVTGDLPVTPAIGPAGSSASPSSSGTAAPVTESGRVPAGVSAIGVAGAAAALSRARAARQSARHESGRGRSASRQSAGGQSAGDQLASSQAIGVMRRGLRQPVFAVTAPVPVATASVTVTASPGP